MHTRPLKKIRCATVQQPCVQLWSCIQDLYRKYCVCNSATAMCAAVIMHTRPIQKILCVQQCNSHVCMKLAVHDRVYVQQCNSHVCMKMWLCTRPRWCVQQCNSHVCNCDHTRPSLEGNNMVCMCNSATAMCATTCDHTRPIALKKITWCVQQCNSHACVYANCDHTRPSLELRKYAWCAQTVCKSTCSATEYDGVCPSI